MTKDGLALDSTSYGVYGETDKVLDTYAYNGEARDRTGLDYLRARYYDSQTGTFLTEDSYPGSQDDPISQNRYSYAENNPVNYTDSSGHRKHTKISSEEISDGRKYSLLFHYVKVEMSTTEIIEP